MAVFASMSAPQLAAELSGAGIAVPDGGFLSRFLAPRGPKARKKPEPIVWPENLDAENCLAALSGEPIGRVRTFAADAVEDRHILRDVEPGRFSLFSTVGDRASLVSGITGPELVVTLVGLAGLADGVSASAAKFDLTADAASAFFAALDHVRLLTFASLVERVGLRSATFDMADLEAQLDAAGDGADNRWFCALHSHLLDKPIGRKGLKAGCESLVEQGYLHVVKAGRSRLFRPSDALVGAALDLLIPLPAMLLVADNLSYRAMLLSGGTPWVMRRHEDGILLENTSGRDAGNLVFNVIGRMLEVADADIAPNAAPSPVPEASPKPGRMSGKHSTPPRKANPPTASQCPACGTKIKPGHLFCTECGARMSA